MPRIAGIDIPREKRVEAALAYVYGVGPTLSKKILAATQIDPNKRAKDLSEEELTKLRNFIEKSLTVEGALRHRVALNIKRLKDVQSYRGLRHIRNLPVQGQRSRTNARTKRGRRGVIGFNKKKLNS